MISRSFIIAIAGLVMAACAPAGEDTVVLYNGGPHHTGVYDTKPLRELTGLKWKHETAGDVTSPPLIDDGVEKFRRMFVTSELNPEDGVAVAQTVDPTQQEPGLH